MLEVAMNRKLLIGKDSIKEITSVLEWYGKKKVFLAVYHKEAASVKTAISALTEKGVPYVVYDSISSEPNLQVIDDGAALCSKEGCDAVVAIGGGSVMDAAKTIGMIATNGGSTEDYQLNGKEVTVPPLLFIAVPTTAGTGAEATKVSVVYNEKKGFKKAIYHNSMIADAVILDPMTTIGLPKKVTVSTGMDAITHAIEAYTSLNANAISRMYSLKALELLYGSIVTACEEPENLAAREDMLLGSYFAGCAIAVGTCLAHIVGQPVGAVYKIPHGDSCSIFLIPSMKINKEYALKQYAEIAVVLGVDGSNKTESELFDAGVTLLEQLCEKIGAPAKLTSFVSAEQFDMENILDNIQTSMGHIKHNPRPVSRELFQELLLAVL